jgi:hypothetical protein
MNPRRYDLPLPCIRAGLDPHQANPDDPVNIDLVAKILCRSQATVRDMVECERFPPPDFDPPPLGRKRWVWRLSTLVETIGFITRKGGGQ